MTAQDVLDFWFLPPGAEGYGKPRDEWFRKNSAFDALIRTQFGPHIELAVAGGLREWDQEGVGGVLARILLLDQFTRNAYRGTAESFAGDALALAAARQIADNGADQSLIAVQRWFSYMPFEHAENAAMQERSVELFTALAEANAGYEDVLDYALRHRGVIARFGRFPGRNAALGRASTPEEVAYLAAGGSGF
jgi:uncharacterized protein (DUF924 family)